MFSMQALYSAFLSGERFTRGVLPDFLPGGLPATIASTQVGSVCDRACDEKNWFGAVGGGQSEGWSSNAAVMGAYCAGARLLSHLRVLVPMSVLLLSSRL